MMLRLRQVELVNEAMQMKKKVLATVVVSILIYQAPGARSCESAHISGYNPQYGKSETAVAQTAPLFTFHAQSDLEESFFLRGWSEDYADQIASWLILQAEGKKEVNDYGFPGQGYNFKPMPAAFGRSVIEWVDYIWGLADSMGGKGKEVMLDSLKSLKQDLASEVSGLEKESECRMMGEYESVSTQFKDSLSYLKECLLQIATGGCDRPFPY
ncbi:MAG: hypothetical protein LBI20_01875 [Holosporales bacterium]|jgi:hypothetical protein|nr:hypothetical protein [Holosporales bacterium]